MRLSRPLPATLVAAAALAASLFAVVPAYAGNTAKLTLTRNLTVPAGGNVSVENLVGRMEIVQGGSQVEVTARVVAGGKDQAAADALAKTVKLTVETSGNKVNLHVDYPVDQYDRYRYDPMSGGPDTSDCLFGFLCGQSSSSLTYQGTQVRVYQHHGDGVPLYVDLEIKLPAGINADLTNHIGFIKVGGVKDNLALHSDSSDMQANQITGNLSMETGSGDIGLAEQNGAVVIHTGSGDVKVNKIQGNLNLHTGSGDISGGDIQANTLETDTGSGDVILSNLSGALNVRAGSGDIRLTDVKVHGSAMADTGSGDITLSGDLSSMDGFDLRAGSGDITLSTSQPPAVHLDITTGSGDINMHWSGVRNITSSEDSFSGDIGAAKAIGKIHTGSGDVNLKQ